MGPTKCYKALKALWKPADLSEEAKNDVVNYLLQWHFSVE